MSAIKTKSIVNRIVNETINEKFGNETSAGNLLITETDEEGSIEMVQSNTAAINNLISELLVELQDRYKNGEAGYGYRGADRLSHRKQDPFAERTNRGAHDNSCGGIENRFYHRI